MKKKKQNFALFLKWNVLVCELVTQLCRTL